MKNALMCAALLNVACGLERGPSNAKPGETILGGSPTPTEDVSASALLGCESTLCCPAGLKIIEGSASDDKLMGRGGPECLVALDGNDRVDGKAHGDTLLLGDGNDIGYGRSGPDIIFGHGGDDTLIGDGQADRLYGGPGNDHLLGYTHSDELFGGEGDDQIDAGAGDDLVRGGKGIDRTFGEAGDDTFVIGAVCEVSNPGEVVDGGPGFDRVESPFTREQLETFGVTFTSIEEFSIIEPRFDECVVTSRPWGDEPVQVEDGRLYFSAADALDNVLAGTVGSVYQISSSGELTFLRDGDQVVINPDGTSYGVYQNAQIFAFSATGTLLHNSAADIAGQFFELIPGTQRLFFPDVGNGLVDDDIEVDSVSIFDPGGVLVSTIATPGYRWARLASDTFVYGTLVTTHRISYEGLEQWSINMRLLEARVARNAGTDMVVGLRISDGPEVVHLQDGTLVAKFATEAPVWNLAISSDGRYSVGTTKSELFIFDNGAPVGAVTVPTKAIVSVDINDQGEVTIGAEDESKVGHVYLYHWSGAELFHETLSFDPNGYRPWTEFHPSGDTFLAIENAGISAFEIAR